MFMDSEKKHHPCIIDHLATFDFQFLRALLEADNTRRTSLIHENYGGKHRNLTDALKYRPMRDTATFGQDHDDPSNSPNLVFEGDEYGKRNLAWLWSNQDRPQAVYFQNCNLDLRAWGYVFWDKDRWDRSGILREQRPLFLPYLY